MNQERMNDTETMTPKRMTPTTTLLQGIPDSVLIEILHHLSQYSHLPICQVSKQFRCLWRHVHVCKAALSSSDCAEVEEASEESACVAKRRRRFSDSVTASASRTRSTSLSSLDPDQEQVKTHAVSSLFSRTSSTFGSGKMLLSKNMFDYFVSCGLAEDPSRLTSAMIMAVTLGDVDGMAYIVKHGNYTLQDPQICTAAASAGQLDALMYARDLYGCPWTANEAYAAAAKHNWHNVMVYIYLNSEDNEIAQHAAGMPV